MSERTPEEISLELAGELRAALNHVKPLARDRERDREAIGELMGKMTELSSDMRSMREAMDIWTPLLRGNGKPSLEVRLANLETVTLSNAKKINETAEAVRKHSSAISFLQGSWKVICIVGGIVALAITVYAGMRK